MALVVCPKHGRGAQFVCPHIQSAVLQGVDCAGIKFLAYSAKTNPDFEAYLAAWYCPQCEGDNQLPPDGTDLANAEEFLERTDDIRQPICPGCFTEWRHGKRGRKGNASAFLNPREFTFIDELESHWQAIRDEYLALPTDSFDPWVQRHMHNGGWSVFGLVAAGQPIPPACAQCPRTSEAIARIPGLSMAGFSRLAPKAHVVPHVGWGASVYRMHLGLVVPPGCRLRSADETRNWQEGRCLIFDDTIEHEAWNDSDSPRAVLLVDFMRPGFAGKAADHVPEEVQQYAMRMFGLEPT